MSPESQIQDVVNSVYEKYAGLNEGEVATYIPELSKANPHHFGISIVSTDGVVCSAGNYEQEFTIQSICKPFAFLLALEGHGREGTLARVGVEPSGDAFNSIELDPKTLRPYNPMINAGAIAIASLIKQNPPEAGVRAFVERMGKAAGRSLRIDQDVLASETFTGHRNRAIAYLMLNWGVIEGEVEQILFQYFSQCSLLVNCRDLAMLGATLANMGSNPVTGQRVFDFQYVKDVLTVMFTCGLYDHAGEWAYHVGIPAKSGVSGGIVAVVNRQLGIAVYSPRVDAKGNSVRGIAACRELASQLGLHAFEFTNVGSSFMQWLSAD
ncbi:MAG: glutaminase A [Acidobacteria bacterium]|nr:glutaminase A [Acidobacteriota bacterium]